MTGGFRMPYDREGLQSTRRALELVGEEIEYGPGEEVMLDPCVADHYLAKIEKQTGRPCPLVEVMPENETAVMVVGASLMKHTMGLATAALIAHALTEPGEAVATFKRISNVLHGEKVLDLLYPKREQ